MTREGGCPFEARPSPSLCHSEARVFPSPVILRSFAPKNLLGHVSGTGEKILRFAQNDNGGDRMTIGGQNDTGRKAAIRWRALPPPLSF